MTPFSYQFYEMAHLALAPARADDIADFYRGKTITLTVAFPPGGGYDIFARLAARFMPKPVDFLHDDRWQPRDVWVLEGRSRLPGR